MPLLSIIVPVYNEQASVAALHAELARALTPLGSHEIIFINDGSTDGTLAALRALKGITVVDLRRNYGQAAALDAGFKNAAGDLIVSIDGDGQNDPRDIPRLIDCLQKNDLDVVAGWRQKRRDPPSVRLMTRIGRLLRRALLGDAIHDSGCTLRVYTREAAASVSIGGEMHRYLVALLRFKGFRIGELPVNHRARNGGRSKYGLGKAVRGFIDLLYVWFIYKYWERPLHLFGYFAGASALLGALSCGWTLYLYFAMGLHIARDVWVAVTLLFFIAALLFFSFGIVIDLLVRVRPDASSAAHHYSIRAIIRT